MSDRLDFIGFRWVIESKIAVCSREWIEAKEDLAGLPSCIISIYDASDKPRSAAGGTVRPLIKGRAVYVADRPVRGESRLTMNDAEEIAAWVGVWSGFPAVICQCEDGGHRSSAVALAVADHYGQQVPNRAAFDPDERFYKMMIDALEHRWPKAERRLPVYFVGQRSSQRDQLEKLYGASYSLDAPR
ncbi:MAG: hypothetical protein EON58_02290 [Alphaproteobacteria bacterium]|nr:MAG: hypothetical protein EON58_02290 [Alphaproteobacteria bacterium]